MRLVELNLGMGNLRSLQKAVEYCGGRVLISDQATDIEKADGLLLPGDGAFGKAMEEIKKRQLLKALKNFVENKRPLLGICLGFQLLFTESEEFGHNTGLGFLEGSLKRFSKNLIVPHMGWNLTQLNTSSRLLQNLPQEAYFYYVHSYYLPSVSPYTIGICHYGEKFTAIVEKENLFGVQFHPEKSQKWGLEILRNFLKIVQEFA